MDLNITKKENGNYENDLEGNKSRTKKVVSFEVPKVEIKSNKEREDKLCVRYEKGLKKT